MRNKRPKIPAPLFSYFGSKIRLSPLYPKPKYDVIIEPFAGAAGYSRLYYDRTVILYEMDPVICGILEYLIRATPEHILSLPPMSPLQEVRDLDVTDTERNLIGFYVNRSSCYPCNKMSPFAVKAWLCDHPSGWTDRGRKRLAKIVTEIKHWRIACSSWDDIPVRDFGECTWFVDPPYQRQGREYRFGSNNIDYQRLGEWCRNLPGQVIVCESTRADWLPFHPFATHTTARKKMSEEAIWTKG